MFIYFSSFWFTLFYLFENFVNSVGMAPQTLIGRCLGFLCALMGVFCIALPVPAIVENFQKLNAAMNMETLRNKEAARRKEFLANQQMEDGDPDEYGADDVYY